MVAEKCRLADLFFPGGQPFRLYFEFTCEFNLCVFVSASLSEFDILPLTSIAEITGLHSSKKRGRVSLRLVLYAAC